MELFLEIIQFFFYSLLLVLISKYLLVTLIRKLAMTLHLSSKSIGNIAGIATSVPELLSSCFAAISGLIETSWFNIVSSNIINVLQYLFTIWIHRNQKYLNNLALKIDLILVISTIFIPIFFMSFTFMVSPSILPLFLLLFALFYYINHNAHHLYLSPITSTEELDIDKERKWLIGKKKKTLFYTIALIFTSLALFEIGHLLSGTLEKLCLHFSISEWIIGIALGFMTSLPELITFLEAQKHHAKFANSQEGVIEATNNLLTSNMMNVFLIQSLAILLFHIVS